MNGLRLLIVGSYDSFLKAGLALGRAFELQGATIETCIIRARFGQISNEQLKDLGIAHETERLSLGKLLTKQRLAQYDAVIVALAGRPSLRFQKTFSTLWQGAQKRPLTISLYPGVVFRFHYEGMMWRMAADTVLLNSQHDLEMYQGLHKAAGFRECNGLVGGLSQLTTPQASQKTQGAKTLLFVGQPTVPRPLSERRVLLHKLFDLARRNPQCEVLLKPRHRPHETTLHRTRYHFSKLVAEATDVPANFSITYEPLNQLWERTSVCLSLSSTAVVEALWQGIPSRVLTDLGLHENFGNHFFLGSDLLCNTTEVSGASAFRLAPDWAERHISALSDQFSSIEQRLADQLEEQRQAGSALPTLGYGSFELVRTPGVAGGFFQKLQQQTGFHSRNVARQFAYCREWIRRGGSA